MWGGGGGGGLKLVGHACWVRWIQSHIPAPHTVLQLLSISLNKYGLLKSIFPTAFRFGCFVRASVLELPVLQQVQKEAVTSNGIMATNLVK